jgi:hypothetical protein
VRKFCQVNCQTVGPPWRTGAATSWPDKGCRCQVNRTAQIFMCSPERCQVRKLCQVNCQIVGPWFFKFCQKSKNSKCFCQTIRVALTTSYLNILVKREKKFPPTVW